MEGARITQISFSVVQTTGISVSDTKQILESLGIGYWLWALSQDIQ